MTSNALYPRLRAALALLGVLAVAAACTGLGEPINEAGKVYDDAPPTVIQPIGVFGGYGQGPGQFAEPRQIAFDRSGNLYIADFRNYRVQVLDSSHKFVRTWGEKGNGPGDFNDPCGINVAPNGDVIVADTWNNRVQVFSNEGQFKYQMTGMVAPRGIEVDGDGTIYVTDSLNCMIKVFSPSGALLRSWGECGLRPRQFNEPVGLVLARDGSLFVCDNDNGRMQVFDKSGAFKSEFPVRGWIKTGWREPYIDELPDGTFVISLPELNKVLRIDGQGKVLNNFGGEGGAPGQFMRPTGVAVSPLGLVYVMDTWNHRIQVFDLSKAGS